jgi:nitroimidazol reductase NimA-like FMN-containing flavoprotein (pyridoxamine 5'-phosphate oxidase superfamily)
MPTGPHVCFKVVAIREAVEDIARLESAVASGKAQPGEVDSLKHAADHAVEDLRCHVDSEALAAAARQEGLILHKVAFCAGHKRLRTSLSPRSN